VQRFQHDPDVLQLLHAKRSQRTAPSAATAAAAAAAAAATRTFVQPVTDSSSVKVPTTVG
jgi:hypothetical protein